NPRFGLLFSPHDSVDVRVSYGTSFRAPNGSEEITDTGAPPDIYIYPGFALPDGGTGAILLLVGSQPLKAEEASEVAAGIDYRPASLPGLRLSAGYFDIDYKNRIMTPPFDPAALLAPDVYGSFITSFPSDAQTMAFVDSQLARGSTLLDLVGTGLPG